METTVEFSLAICLSCGSEGRYCCGLCEHEKSAERFMAGEQVGYLRDCLFTRPLPFGSSDSRTRTITIIASTKHNRYCGKYDAACRTLSSSRARGGLAGTEDRKRHEPLPKPIGSGVLGLYREYGAMIRSASGGLSGRNCFNGAGGCSAIARRTVRPLSARNGARPVSNS